MKMNRFYTNAVALLGVASLGLLTQLPARAQMGTSQERMPGSTEMQNENIDIDSPSDLPNVDSQSERVDQEPTGTPFPIRTNNNTTPTRTNNNDRMNQDQIDVDSPSDLPNVDSQSERIDRAPTNNSVPNRTNNNTTPNRTNNNSSTDRMNQPNMDTTPSISLPQQPTDSQPGLPNEMSPAN